VVIASIYTGSGKSLKITRAYRNLLAALLGECLEGGVLPLERLSKNICVVLHTCDLDAGWAEVTFGVRENLDKSGRKYKILPIDSDYYRAHVKWNRKRS